MSKRKDKKFLNKIVKEYGMERRSLDDFDNDNFLDQYDELGERREVLTDFIKKYEGIYDNYQEGIVKVKADENLKKHSKKWSKRWGIGLGLLLAIPPPLHPIVDIPIFLVGGLIGYLGAAGYIEGKAEKQVNQTYKQDLTVLVEQSLEKYERIDEGTYKSDAF